MFLEFFSLSHNPFRAKASPEDVFVGPQQAAIVSGLRNALVERDAAVIVMGPVGAGKTVAVQRALDTFPGRCETVRLGRMRLGRDEILEELISGLKGDCSMTSTPRRVAEFQRLLEEREAQDVKTIVVVEDGLRLGLDGLLELESLTSSDAGSGANLVLMGPPDLHDLLESSELARLKQRVCGRLTLAELSATETCGYLATRARAAGSGAEDLFDSDAITALHAHSGGIARVINRIGSAALRAAADAKLERADASIVAAVAEADHALPPAASTATAAQDPTDRAGEPEPADHPELGGSEVAEQVEEEAAAEVQQGGSPARTDDFSAFEPAAVAPVTAKPDGADRTADVGDEDDRGENAASVPELIQDTMPGFPALKLSAGEKTTTDLAAELRDKKDNTQPSLPVLTSEADDAESLDVDELDVDGLSEVLVSAEEANQPADLAAPAHEFENDIAPGAELAEPWPSPSSPATQDADAMGEPVASADEPMEQTNAEAAPTAGELEAAIALEIPAAGPAPSAPARAAEEVAAAIEASVKLGPLSAAPEQPPQVETPAAQRESSAVPPALQEPAAPQDLSKSVGSADTQTIKALDNALLPDTSLFRALEPASDSASTDGEAPQARNASPPKLSADMRLSPHGGAPQADGTQATARAAEPPRLVPPPVELSLVEPATTPAGAEAPEAEPPAATPDIPSITLEDSISADQEAAKQKLAQEAAERERIAAEEAAKNQPTPEELAAAAELESEKERLKDMSSITEQFDANAELREAESTDGGPDDERVKLEELAAQLGDAKSLEEVDDVAAETLFGVEFSQLANTVTMAAVGQSEPTKEEARELELKLEPDEIPLAAAAQAGNGAAVPATAPPTNAGNASAGPTASATAPSVARAPIPEPGSLPDIDSSAARRLEMVRSLNGNKGPAIPPPGAAEEIILGDPDPAPTLEGPAPDRIEDQFGTSMTANLEALSMSTIQKMQADEEAQQEDAEEEAAETPKKRGFLSRFKRS